MQVAAIASDLRAALPQSVRKAYGFPSSQNNLLRLRLTRRSRTNQKATLGKPEAFRTEGGKAARTVREALLLLSAPAPFHGRHYDFQIPLPLALRSETY
jgi:hypothetical protein